MIHGFIEDLAEINAGKLRFPLHETRFDLETANEVARVVLDGNVSALGEEIALFETEIKKYVGAGFAVGVSSGTAALHLSLHALGVGVGDEVLVPTCTFVATVNAVMYTGAKPIFVDSEELDLGIDPNRLVSFLTSNSISKDGFTFNKLTGARIRAIVIMHVLGNPADSQRVKEICDEFNLLLVEDAAESLGSFENGRHTGLTGNVGVLSFNGNKILTTGNGGAVITDNEELATRIRHISSTAKVPHKWEFHHDQLAWNYRLPNLNAALGLGQLKTFSKTLDLKRQLALYYRNKVNKHEGLDYVSARTNTVTNNWLCAIRLTGATMQERDFAIQSFHQIGFNVRPLWNLMHSLNFLDKFQKTDTSNSERHFREIICLPSSSHILSDLGVN